MGKFYGYGTQDFAAPPVLYSKATDRLRVLCATGTYEIVKRFERQDPVWPYVYLILDKKTGNTLHFFTRQRIG